MGKFNKWIRIVHRWLGIPLMTALALTIGMSIANGPGFVTPGWLNTLGLVSILSLALTGVIMFWQYYINKWRRAARAKKSADAPVPLPTDVQ